MRWLRHYPPARTAGLMWFKYFATREEAEAHLAFLDEHEMADHVFVIDDMPPHDRRPKRVFENADWDVEHRWTIAFVIPGGFLC